MPSLGRDLAERMLVVAAFALVIAACRGDGPKAMSYVETCSPGQSFEACRASLRPSDGHAEALQAAFPAGDLIALRLDVVSGATDPKPEQPLHVMLRFSLGYTMITKTGADCGTIAKLVQPELGAPARGTPPGLGSPSKDASPDAIYWATEEGDWACTPSGVSWYSLPLDGYRVGSEDENHLDRFVKPAPKSAALWRKIGRALIER